MATIEGAGVALAYTDDGSGPPVLVVHGLASDARAWAWLAADLAGEARVVRYDRRGYGGSGAPEPYEGTTVNEQAQDAAALVRGTGIAPALVVGDGFGALVALDLSQRHPEAVGGLVAIDPPLLMLVPAATAELSQAREQIAQAVLADGPPAGVEAWLALHGGARDGEGDQRARLAHRAFFADYAGLASWPLARRELRALELPAVVLTRPTSTATELAAADALVELLPAAQRRRDGDVPAAVRTLIGAAGGSIARP